MKEFWDAHPYGDRELGWRARLFLKPVLAVASGKRVLELGCGMGAASAAVAEVAESVTAVDFSPAMLEGARGRHGGIPNLTFVTADIVDDDLGGTYDIVFGTMVLHEVRTDRFDALCSNIDRHMAPGSFAWFQENSYFNPLFRAFRSACVGRFGVPKLGSYDERPFDEERLATLRARFRHVLRTAEAFALFEQINNYIVRANALASRADAADRFVSAHSPDKVRRALSYLQHIYFSNDVPRVEAFAPALVCGGGRCAGG